MSKKNFYFQLLKFILWLAEDDIDNDNNDCKIKLCCLCHCCCHPKRATRLKLTSVRIDGILVKGDIEMAKKEFGGGVRFSFQPVMADGSPGAIQAGSATHQLGAVYTDAEGGDASADYTMTVDPTNELVVDVQHNGNARESTATATVRADADTDTDEEAIINGAGTLIIDSPNAVGFTVAESDIPAVEPPPVEPPVEEPPVVEPTEEPS